MQLPKMILLTLALAPGMVASCSPAKAPGETGRAQLGNPNCLPNMAAEKLAVSPVSARAAKRLAQHYGACLYDGDGAVRWLRVAVKQRDPQAMVDLATLLEGRAGPNAKTEVADLRQSAAAIIKANVR
jgi:hypothetical protein